MNDIRSFEKQARYHLVGVAGVGMSALAGLLLARGASVSGSDRYYDSGREHDVLNKLSRAGLRLLPQNGAGVELGLSALIYSSAIEEDNPDFIAAAKHGIPLAHRAAMLAELAKGKQLLAVAGTSGKTTVTGMIGWILEQAGADPTVVNGGAVLNWVDERSVGNMRAGGSSLWVVEVDESDRSLLRFNPDWAVITNISKDHFEVSEAESLFKTFAAKVVRGTVGVLGDAGWLQIIRDFKPRLTAFGSQFEYDGASFELPLLGAHNAENALLSAMACKRLGVAPSVSAEALASIKGIQRRLERVGSVGGITVIDDYAHNPAKIAAAWRAIKPFHKRVFAVWRPHGYGPLAALAAELSTVFKELVRSPDSLMLLPVYYAGGTVSRTLSTESFAADLKEAGVPAAYVSDYPELMELLLKNVGSGDAVLFMGARDPSLPAFARSFFAQLSHLVAQRAT